MSQSPNLQQIIYDSLFNQNNQQRSQSENLLFQLSSQNPGSFLLECSQILSEEQNNSQIRFACGTVFKRIMTQAKPNNQHIWLQIQNNIREEIKENLLGTLISSDVTIRKSAADSISVVTLIELPLKMWDDLIPNLSQNLQHTDVEIKKAAILTLGFICEQLKLNDVMNCLDSKQVENILMGILLGMQKTENDMFVKLLAVKALFNSLQFMNQLLERQDIRIYLLDLLVACSLEQQQEEIQIQALQCLIELGKMQYHNLGQNIKLLFNLISHLISSQNTQIAILTIEIWTTIATEDVDLQDKSLKVINQISIDLICLLLQNLVRQPDQGDEEGGNNIQESTKKCLMMVVESTKDESVETFQKFISNTITSDDWTHRQASVIAFGALIEGPSKETIQNMIQTISQMLLSLLKDQNVKVIEATIETFRRISEFYPQCLLQILQQILPFLMNGLQSDNFKICKTCCFIFNHLGDGINNQNQEYSAYFIQNMDSIMYQLVAVGMKQYPPQYESLVEFAFTSLINLIYYGSDFNLADKYLKLGIQVLNQQQLTLMQKSGILALLHGTVLIMSNQLTENTLDSVYQIIVKQFQNQQGISQDGLFVIGALATSGEKNFTKYLQDSQKYLKYGFSKQDEPELFKASFMTLGDIARASANDFVIYIDDYVPMILQFLNDPNFDRDLQMQILMCLADLCLSSDNCLSKYLDQILSIYNNIFEICISLSYSNDLNQAFYADALKEKLVETFTCICHSMLTFNFEKMVNFVPNVCNFIFKVTEKQLNPTVEFLKNCLALLSDIASTCGNRVTKYIKNEQTQNLVNQLSKFQHVQDTEMIIRYSIGVLQKLS